MNVFYPKAPLHDGAMIIRNFEIIAAGCFLPLSTREVASDLGTRHRAATVSYTHLEVILINESLGF